MQKPRLRTSTPLLLLGISIYLSGCPNLIAQATEFQGQTENGAYYKIALPENWQPHDGLVIWNHGYQGYTKTELEPDPSLGPLADIALPQGYAMAASSYSQTGWAVFNSHIDNQQLYQKFVELAGDPGGIFIQGASLGGIVSMRDLEEGLIPGIDGAFLMCGAVAGATNWDQAFDLRMVYEAVCKEVDGAELPTDSWSEQPDPIGGEAQFLNSLERCTGLISAEFLGAPLAQLLQRPGQSDRMNTILELTDTDREFLLLDLAYAVFEIPNLVSDKSKLNGLKPFANAGIDYGNADINTTIQRSIALPSARQFFLDNYTPRGSIGDTKVVSIHTSKDGLVKVENQQTLLQLLPADQLTTAIVVEAEASHCGFSMDEGAAAWNQLLAWSAGAAQPDAQDIQESCQAANSDPDQCRFDVNFQLGDSILSFPREHPSGSPTTSMFHRESGLLLIESLAIAGNSTVYDIELVQTQDNGALFTLESVTEISPAASWQLKPLFFPADSMLYLPNLRLLPYGEDDALYDVYLEYTDINGGDGLRLLEFELAN